MADQPSSRVFSSGSLKLLITALVFVGGAGFLVFSSLGEAVFYKHVDELLADPEPFVGKTLKVHGFVEAGSIHEEIVGQDTQREFVLTYEGARVLVKDEGPKPDTFKDLAEVVATGKVIKEDGRYVVMATELSAKCPSKYQGETRTDDYAKPPPEPNVEGLENAPSASR